MTRTRLRVASESGKGKNNVKSCKKKNQWKGHSLVIVIVIVIVYDPSRVVAWYHFERHGMAFQICVKYGVEKF